jgi:hypothetical protein
VRAPSISSDSDRAPSPRAFMTSSGSSMQSRVRLDPPPRSAGDFEEEEEEPPIQPAPAAPSKPPRRSHRDDFSTPHATPHHRWGPSLPSGGSSAGQPPARPRPGLVPEQRPPHVANAGNVTAYAALEANARQSKR